MTYLKAKSGLKYIQILSAGHACSVSPIGKVLAWTLNYETSVFDLYDPVHPATATVWFELVTDTPNR